MEKRFITVKELSEYTGWSQSAIYHMICRRELQYIKWGRSVRFDLRKIDRFIEDKTIAAKSKRSFKKENNFF